jgi:acetyltransferase-like isoleucine patch superfamily enzyme
MASIPSQEGVSVGKGTLCNYPIKLIPPPEGIRFGKFCALGPNLKIIGTNHDYNFMSIQYTFYNTYFRQAHPIDAAAHTFSKGPVTIGNDVWIGEDVTILSGVTIGDGVCIGAGSIVTRNLEPYSICIGTPCKKSKMRYKEDVVDFLLKLKWWDWEDDKIRANKTLFNMNLNTCSLVDIGAAIV